jgi:hypothetical protein
MDHANNIKDIRMAQFIVYIAQDIVVPKSVLVLTFNILVF